MQSLVKIPDITARFYYREFHISHSSRAQAEMSQWLLCPVLKDGTRRLADTTESKFTNTDLRSQVQE